MWCDDRMKEQPRPSTIDYIFLHDAVSVGHLGPCMHRTVFSIFVAYMGQITQKRRKVSGNTQNMPEYTHASISEAI